MIDIEKDAARFRWLVDNAIRINPANRDGPEYPELTFYFDLFSYYLRDNTYDVKKAFIKALDDKMKYA